MQSEGSSCQPEGLYGQKQFNVGCCDGIADYQTMQNRIGRLRARGTDAEIEVFEGLPMVLDWAPGQWRRDGWTEQSDFGKNR